MIVPLTAACVAAAAAAYGVGQPALWTILKTESGHIGACSVNTNGSHDCGPAQINAEIWVPYFADLLHRSDSEMFYDIRDNGCFNVYAAAYIVRLKVIEAKGDVWDGMGRYNSATPALKEAYQRRLVEAYRQLFVTAQR